MGEVYRARDARLSREVAIKILPAQFSADPDRLRRFEQEARATGMLNHPNILAVYDIGTEDGTVYVVSELLSGETLRERLGGSPIPVRKAIEYSLQIAHDWAGAESEYKRSIELNPSYPTCHHWYALLLAAMERSEESIAQIKLAQGLDPLSLVINAVHGRTRSASRMLD